MILTLMGLGLLDPEPVSLGLRRGVGGEDSSSEIVIARLELGSLELRRVIRGLGCPESASLVGVLGGVVSDEPFLIVSICRDLSPLKVGAGRGGSSSSSSSALESLSVSSSYMS